MKKAFLISVLVLVACTTSREIVLPDGTKGQKLTCNGAVQTIEDCVAKAGEICPKGYDVLGGSGEAHRFYNAGGSGPGFYATSGSIVSRSLIVKCH